MANRSGFTPVSGVWSGVAALELLELFRSRPRPVSLRIVGAFERCGRLRFDSGNIVFAETPTSTGIDALAELLTWADAKFETEADSPTAPNIDASYMAAVLDALERLGERKSATPLPAVALPIAKIPLERVTMPRLEIVGGTHDTRPNIRVSDVTALMAARVDYADASAPTLEIRALRASEVAELTDDDLIEVEVDAEFEQTGDRPALQADGLEALRITAKRALPIIATVSAEDASPANQADRDSTVGDTELVTSLARLPVALSWFIARADGSIRQSQSPPSALEIGIVATMCALYANKQAAVAKAAKASTILEVALQLESFWLLRPWRDSYLVVHGDGGATEYAMLNYQLKRVLAAAASDAL